MGNIKRASGDTNGAASKYAEAIRSDANFALAYFNRGVLEFNVRDFDRALMDLRQAIDLGTSTDVADQARLYVWIIRVRKGERGAANQELTARLAQRPIQYIDNWIARRMEFLTGAVSEAALREAARTPSTLFPVALAKRSAQASFLIGVTRKLSGDVLNARRFLAECVALDHSLDSPAGGAEAELAEIR